MSRLYSVCQPATHCHSVDVLVISICSEIKIKYFTYIYLASPLRNQKQKLFQINEFTRNIFLEKSIEVFNRGMMWL